MIRCRYRLSFLLLAHGKEGEYKSKPRTNIETRRCGGIRRGSSKAKVHLSLSLSVELRHGRNEEPLVLEPSCIPYCQTARVRMGVSRSTWIIRAILSAIFALARDAIYQAGSLARKREPRTMNSVVALGGRCLLVAAPTNSFTYARFARAK